MGTVYKHVNEDYVTNLSQIIHSVVKPACAALVVISLQGCAISSITSGFGGGIFGGKKKTTVSSSEHGSGVSERTLLSAAQADLGGSNTSDSIGIAVGCPKFKAAPDNRLYTKYEPGREGSSLGIIYRGEITKTARECKVSPGNIGIRYGFAGRVLLGSQGRDGTVTLPAIVYVSDRNNNRIKQEKMNIRVNVSRNDPIGFFSIVKVIKFSVPNGARALDYKLFVAFQQPQARPRSF